MSSPLVLESSSPPRSPDPLENRGPPLARAPPSPLLMENLSPPRRPSRSEPPDSPQPYEPRGLRSEEGQVDSPGCPLVHESPAFAYQASTPSEWQDAVAPILGQAWTQRLADGFPDSSNCSSDGSYHCSGRQSRSYRSGQNETGDSGSAASQRAEQRIRCADGVNWDDIRLAHKIRPYSHYAHCADDLRLLGHFLELAGLEDVHTDSVKLLLRTLKFLRLCDYSAEDICTVLAHASAYFASVHALCGDQMDTREVGNVLATLMFLAHSFVQDETCPLHIWHQYLFRKYCPLKTLNAAVIRLMELMHFMLRLPDPVLW
eukprot:CAMPEP_0206528094 /NCGR_PEP_ID=MMETSP0325_2-20121206/1748_1 /ASSEMBLY_ACC=CAM_ASM_000347 /TAXON_ID=2866 /ORGANISM="Crypthecodinium cohnii, Strain Seligo" /LENGTH=316 /DNA_ID=CAMNT_0054023647 /DNA_START=321 /DNA_END=1268 /DNA_ORIENTATION=-